MIFYIVSHTHACQSFRFGKIEEALHFTVETVSHLFQHDVRIGILPWMLADSSDTCKDLIHVRHVEIAAKSKILSPPVITPQERVHIGNAALSGSGITQVPHVSLARKREIFLSVIRIMKLFFCQILKVTLHRTEYLGNGTRTECTLTEHILFTGICFQLYTSQTGAFLSAVVLLLHQKIEFVQTVHPCAVLLFIVFQRFQQAYHGNATFMLQFFHQFIYNLQCTKYNLPFTIYFVLPSLFHCDALRQVSRLIHIHPFAYCDMIRQ